MSEFKIDADHLKEHEVIHSGMDRFMSYVGKVREDEGSYSEVEFKKVCFFRSVGGF